jgi:hypothetical protein
MLLALRQRFVDSLRANPKTRGCYLFLALLGYPDQIYDSLSDPTDPIAEKPSQGKATFITEELHYRILQ